MWKIHGKQYDLTKFMNEHPGGRSILEKTKGLEDCTALFETYHAFSDIDSIERRLAAYEVNTSVNSQDAIDSKTIQVYTTDFSSYRELVKRVKKSYPKRQYIKANAQWIFNNMFIFVISVSSFYFCYFSTMETTPFLYKIISQIVYSLCESSILFNIMHDGSHYAISVYPKINEIFSKMAHNLILWNANAWFFHHVYYHHSFTGLENDPDDSLYHFGFITQKNGRLNLIHIFYMLFPGQQFGLAFLYLLMSFTKRYYYIKTQLPTLQYYDTIDMLMCLFKFYCFYRGGIILFVIHALIVNTLYYINVYPNHSTYDTKIENRDGVGSNWTKLQICNTGNFVMDNLWWTRFFGGINYQIEHHLFPNMSNIHYPYVSKIVREYCKEHNIPYVNKATLYDAYISFVKYVQHY